MDYPRGSEWRKWDLHLHPPGTKLADGYDKKNGKLDWDRFCRIIHESDVAAIGITDYFSLDGFFAFKSEYVARYPDDRTCKVFFPNLELRLNEVLNDAGDNVNVHLILPPDLSEEAATRLLSELKTLTTVGKANRPVSCMDLRTTQDYQSATVSRDGLMTALEQTFGYASSLEEFALIVPSATGDGLRPGKKGSKKRKNALVDETDKISHAFFAGPKSRDHFLDTGRLDSGDKVAPKPVFSGCDAHSFEQLETKLGRHGIENNQAHYTTWVKADLTYQGLLQTLIEPEHRVAIQATRPDTKQPYQYISKITFTDSKEFPAEVVFNQNLTAIIGSRSSGKSALLAYIAHAVNPDETVQQQVAASGVSSERVGPAPGLSWADVEHLQRHVEWASPEADKGKVIYIPQNSLFALSEQPDAINKKIEPSLFRAFPALKSTYLGTRAALTTISKNIEVRVENWFATTERIDQCATQIQAIGDRAAILALRDEFQARADELRSQTELTQEEITLHEGVTSQLRSGSTRSQELASSVDQLSRYSSLDDDQTIATPIPSRVHVQIEVTPSASQVPQEVGHRIDELRRLAAAELTARIETELSQALVGSASERRQLDQKQEELRETHAVLLSKHEANTDLAAIVANHSKQTEFLDKMDRIEAERAALELTRADIEGQIAREIDGRAALVEDLKEAFRVTQPALEGMEFGVEISIAPEALEAASTPFDRRRTNTYFPKDVEHIQIETVLENPADFLAAIKSKDVRLNARHTMPKVAAQVLALEPEVRFTAVLEGDRIGGFARSTMTQGKQALFALTLILNETQEPWPLLVDQPEDDLDSRSIYEVVVPYLIARKRERQIIMVTHDANLVIGADSEAVVVANRHGADRPNKDSRAFEYLSGSLEHTQVMNPKSATTLGRCGIREHACEILDGGESAFQKRKEKYKI